MKKLLSLLIVASAIAPLHAQVDSAYLGREEEFQQQGKSERSALESVSKSIKKMQDETKDILKKRAAPKSEAGQVQEKLDAVWRQTLVALGEDSNDSDNYPNLLLACGILFENAPVASCGSEEAKKAMDKERIKHHVLAHKAVNVLIALHSKPDAARLDAISLGIDVLTTLQRRLTEALDSDGRRYRYAYDKTSAAGADFQKDVKDTWETAREYAEVITAAQGSAK